MADDTDAASDDVVRIQDFDVPGPIELDISNSIGPVEIELLETARVHVEVRHDPDSGQPDWRSGLTGLLNWVSEQIGDSGIKTGFPDRDNGRGKERALDDAHAEAVRQTRIDMTGTRLAVHPPSTVPLRTVPLAIRIQAPAESQVGIRTGAGPVSITGTAEKMRIQTGSGAVSTDSTTGSATIRTGSGQIRLGAMPAGVEARSGSGDIEIASLQAPSSVVTGSGDVWLGTVEADLLVRSGSGNMIVAEAVSGQVELITGSGGIRAGIRKGVHAELDITSSTGNAASELDVSTRRPPEEPALRIFGRTGSGEALVTSAV
ncbi:hypothetical protein DFQ14_107227 [Halopolyspora algeriensis]|uniref:DUF4097 domain-containing protein n=1 Tax=Halopolyspora algeriensis TaxID=1500506 RepID=A0A368VS92_9ACTN|nr:DUF4097 family beta strand repeat-containing protein [Halopolyspora algeriensis]RCW43337.1 hypothetical protein DFQ14_107227 [Halopolyspora algeriensis]TQM56394.1 hypothetical protein FHU43_1190 [Halopolyspora algeriensis]